MSALLSYRHGVHLDEDFCSTRRGSPQEPRGSLGREGKEGEVDTAEIVDSLVYLIQSSYGNYKCDAGWGGGLIRISNERDGGGGVLIESYKQPYLSFHIVFFVN